MRAPAALRGNHPYCHPVGAVQGFLGQMVAVHSVICGMSGWVGKIAGGVTTKEEP